MTPDASQSPFALHRSSAAELRERLELERSGIAHLILRDREGRQVIRIVAPEETRITIGRRQGSGVCIGWDSQVSRLHAALERVGEDWTVVDDGLSRNGTFVGAERLHGRRRLSDGDLVTVGRTTLAFRHPQPVVARTESAVGWPLAVPVSTAERRVLFALCRPLGDSPRGLPATNQQIAEELHLSVPAVKKRLGALFDRFQLLELPQNQKRLALAQAAIRGGLVSPSEG